MAFINSISSSSSLLTSHNHNGIHHSRFTPCISTSFPQYNNTRRWTGPALQQQQKRWDRTSQLVRMRSNEAEEKSDRFRREVTPEVKELRSVLKKCSLYLVGPMGCGKSAVGKYLAFELDFRFLDTDDLIEMLAKKPISEIFKDDGEEAFRDLESMVLDQVTPFIACCVATGGGVVLRKENWGHLQTGIVIYLNTPVDVLHDRLMTESEKRPLLNDAESLRDRIEDILHERKHLYDQADVHVQVKAGMAVDEIGKETIRVLTNFIKSNPPKLATLYPGKVPKAKE